MSSVAQIITATAAITLAGCATFRPIPQSPLAPLAAPGPHRVATYTVDWFDAARNRHVPAKIYAPADLTAPAPVIVFSHGLGNSMNGYSYLGEQWASRGFVSVHPNHAGADLEVTRHGLLNYYRAGFDHSLRHVVPADLRFVIDQLQHDDNLPPPLRGKLDLGRIGVSGHSFGAYAALALAGLVVADGDFRDDRVKAAIPMSMSEDFPRSSYRRIKIPMLHVTGTNDVSILYGELPYKRRLPFESIDYPDQILVTIYGAGHSTISDDESSSNHAAHDAVRLSSTLFWDAFLRDDANARTQLTNGDLSRSLAGVAHVETKSAALRVGKVVVKTIPVFSTEEAQRGGFYRAADVLAIQTPESLVRKFLLFHEGEPFDESRLRESERNLRALDFLMSASITTSPPHDGVVDVVVETHDSWTTTPNVDFSNEGGKSIYDVSITQMDLFGRGADIILRTASLRERRTHSIELLDPALLGAYWNADVLAAKSSDGNEERVSLERPLFSHETKRTISASFDHLLQDTRFYALGQVQSLFRQEHREATASAGYALFNTENSATRVLGGVDLVSDTFRLLQGVEPDDRHFRFVELGADTTGFEFVKLDHIDFGLREQDFNIGAHASLIGGWSPPTSGHGLISRVRVDASDGFRLAPMMIVLGHLSGSSRFGDVNRDTILSLDTRFIDRIETAWPQAIVARLRVDHGSNLDREVQFFADGQNGLRAYPNFAFTGSNRQLLNVEHRVYLGRELMQVVEPGAALFLDTGRAGGGPLRTDLGAGIRLGIARWNEAMLRFDLAYALNNSPLSRRGLVFSFATTQAF